MNDYLQNATLRQVLKTLNIPVPVPPILKRNPGAYSDDELTAKKIAVAGKESDFLHQLQKELHPKTGASTIYDTTIDGLVVSCVGMETIEDLEDLYTTIKNASVKIAANGRIVIISKLVYADALSYAVQKSIDGFSKALSKEIGGKKGVTVNQLKITHNEVAVPDVAKAAYFFLSDKSSFITGQVVELNNVTGNGFHSPSQLLKGTSKI
ncbi:MAG: hypothetical protein U0T77_12950 [Chitinophagales bacterium]